MKKLLLSVVTVFLLVFMLAPTTFTAFALSNDNAVIRMNGEIDSGNISVDVVLMKNDGISAMNIELVYDDAALTLVGVEKGVALGSLQYLTTNTETEKGFSIKPFKFDYSGDDNDYSTGRMFTLSFKIKENAANGTYKIALNYERNKSVNYYESGELKTRNLSIDSVEIKINAAAPAGIYTVVETDGSKNVNVPLIVVSAVFAVAGVVVVVVLSVKKRKRWKKI